ncbi:MAG: hypothetical protein JWO36_5358 [Myxococcales bacterium]|nr:hypothetical protein [Myxococcales bacterium]
MLVLAGCGGHAQPEVAPAAKPPAPPPTEVLVGPTTLSPDVVLAKIRTDYMGGVKRCYSVLLKNHGAARGSVMITFTVDPAGVAQHGEAHGFADLVDHCITTQIASWKFPVPKDQTGTPTEASFALPLHLEPE